MRKAVSNLLFLLLPCAICLGQSSYKGLTPGKSTRGDVERTLGKPVKEHSQTLVEYRPQPRTGKIFVQYREDSPVVERIEMLCRTEISTCDDLIRSLNLRLPKEPDDIDVSEASEGDRWRSLYGSPHFIATSGAIADVREDSSPISRLALYSRELYEADFTTVKAANETYIAKIEEGRTKPPVPAPGQITGIVKLNGKPVAGATIDLYRTDWPDLPRGINARTDRYGIFVFVGVFSGTYAAVASGPGIRWTYVGGLKLPLTSALEIVAQPGDGARPSEEQVRAAIR